MLRLQHVFLIVTLQAGVGRCCHWTFAFSGRSILSVTHHLVLHTPVAASALRMEGLTSVPGSLLAGRRAGRQRAVLCCASCSSLSLHCLSPEPERPGCTPSDQNLFIYQEPSCVPLVLLCAIAIVFGEGAPFLCGLT